MHIKSKAPKELKLTRVYDAPLKLVWEAWTDPEQIGKWWGPRGFTLTTHSKDLKTGGHWNYTMHGPDGKDYPNKTVYLEVDPMKRLVYDHGANDQQAALFRVTVLFKDLGGRTELDFTMACASEESARSIKQFIKDAGGTGTWDRLAEHLEEHNHKKRIFVINRSFKAPIESVFEMWTNPEHFANWMGPTGSVMENIVAGIEEGKTLFYKMTAAGNLVMYGKVHYQKIDHPRYLQYTQIFCDEDGNVSRHPMVSIWPEVMQTKVWFSEEEEGHTRITLVWEPYGKPTKEELEVFVNMRSGMTQGWTGSFDKLEECLVRAK